MKYAVVIHSNDDETVWNAFRFANMCLGYEDQVTVFLMGKGVEASSIQSLKFDINKQIEIFEEWGGKLIGCGVCCDSRKDIMPDIENSLNCAIGSMQDFYLLVNKADKVLTF